MSIWKRNKIARKFVCIHCAALFKNRARRTVHEATCPKQPGK